MKKLVSVWLVYGSPQESNGQIGYHRGCTFLMNILSGSGDVASRFINECRKEDNIRYVGAKIETIQFYGMAELPENGSVSNAHTSAEAKTL